jgi:hypothetical protein
MAEGDMMRVRLFVFLILVTAVAYGQSVSDSNVKVVYFQADNHAEVRTLNDVVIQSINAGTDKALEVRVPQIVAIYVQDPNPVFFKYTKGKTTFVTNADYAAALAFAKAIAPGVAGISTASAERVGGQAPSYKGALAAIKEYAEQMPAIARQTLDVRDLPAARAAVDAWDLDSIRQGLAAPDTDDTDDGTSTQGTDIDSLNKRIDLLRTKLANARETEAKHQQQLDEANKTLETLQTFHDAVRAVNTPIRFDPETVDLQQNPTIHLTIDRLPQLGTIDTAPRKTGDVAVPLQAYSPVHLSFGPAMVYSFVKAPSFTTEKQDDGKFKIVEQPGENRAQNISAMLNITPRGWSDATFGGSFQLGISPVKDQMGIFGGVQVRISRLATIGGGYGFQQVPRLDKSQHPGDFIDTADALKTTNHYKGGAYVAITLSLPKDAGQ